MSAPQDLAPGTPLVLRAFDGSTQHVRFVEAEECGDHAWVRWPEGDETCERLEDLRPLAAVGA